MSDLPEWVVPLCHSAFLFQGRLVGIVRHALIDWSMVFRTADHTMGGFRGLVIFISVLVSFQPPFLYGVMLLNTLTRLTRLEGEKSSDIPIVTL